MKKGDLPHTLFSDLDKDFKAEVIAAEMVENGTDADHILITLLGAMKRTFSKDVTSIEEELSEYDHKEYVLLKSPREGIYDMLPQGLFHQSNSYKTGKTEAELIKAIKQRKVEERNARKFFLPFEATINFLRMQMALYENRLDKRSHYDDLVEIFTEHWEIFKYLDARQANIFLHLIPILHDIREDYPVVENVFELIFLFPVKISLRRQLPVHPAEPNQSRMGKGIIGVDLTTGNQKYYEGIDEIMVSIGPIQNETMQLFMPGAVNDSILQLLIDYLLPVHLDVKTHFELSDSDRVTRLADPTIHLNASLGADTFL